MHYTDDELAGRPEIGVLVRALFAEALETTGGRLDAGAFNTLLETAGLKRLTPLRVSRLVNGEEPEVTAGKLRELLRRIEDGTEAAGGG